MTIEEKRQCEDEGLQILIHYAIKRWNKYHNSSGGEISGISSFQLPRPVKIKNTGGSNEQTRIDLGLDS
jgi:hypothetical protein